MTRPCRSIMSGGLVLCPHTRPPFSNTRKPVRWWHLFLKVPMRIDPAAAVALFRYRVIADATNPRLSSAEHGQRVRQLAWRDARWQLARLLLGHPGPLGPRLSGPEPGWPPAPTPADNMGAVRRHPRLLEGRCPSASGASRPVRRPSSLAMAPGSRAHHLPVPGLPRPPARCPGRRLAGLSVDWNELWIGAVLVGPFVPKSVASETSEPICFSLVDDYCRLLLHGCLAVSEFEDVFRRAYF